MTVTRPELEALRCAVLAGIGDAERIIREDRFPGSVSDARANLPEWRRIAERLAVELYPNTGPAPIPLGDGPTITSFTRRYRFLSNFGPGTVFWAGRRWPTVEHAFHAAKCLSVADQLEILQAATPGEAKKLGRRVKLRPDWEDVKTEVMATLVARKFARAELAEALLATGDAFLVEGNGHGDRIWGAVWVPEREEFVGENRLGRILMEVRRALRVEWPNGT